MAKRKGAKTRSAKSDEGMKVVLEFGQWNPDDTGKIDLGKLEELKKKLGKTGWKRVRFVALNAPFKRRSPILPA